MIVNLNGNFVAAAEAAWPIDDGAVLFGDSLFETLLARRGRVRFLADHLDRLELSARLLAFPCDRAGLEEALRQTAQRLGEEPAARLRLTLSRGAFAGPAPPSSKAGRFLATAVPYAEPSEAEREAGAVCLLAPNRRVNPLSHLPQMKRGNYADCLYAADFARSRGAREALFASEKGELLEGATSNLFLVRHGALITAPAGELVLGGILRRRVVQAARGFGLRVEERAPLLAETAATDEAFLSNALIGLLPVRSIDGTPLRRGELWRKLLDEIERQGAQDS